MKKSLLVVSAALLAGLASAAPAKLAEIRLVDAARLTAAVSKFGEQCGNPMISMMAAGAIMQNPLQAKYGPTRADSALTFSIWCDEAALAKDLDKLNENVKAVFFYPVVQNEAKFLKRNPKAKKAADGLIKLDDDEYLIFSKDGKWLVASEDAEVVRLAAKHLDYAREPLTNALVKVSVSESSMKLIREGLAKQNSLKKVEGKKLSDDERKAQDVIACLGAWEILLNISDKGLTFAGFVTPVAGTELDKVGRAALGKDPLGFAPAKALYASALAANCGGAKVGLDVKWASFAAYLAKLGGDVSKFVSVETKGSGINFVLDPKAAGDYFEGPGSNVVTKVEADEIKKIWAKGEATNFSVVSPAQSFSFALKRAQPKASPATILKTTLGDLAQKPLFTVSAGSLYGTLAAIVPVALSMMNEEDRAMLAPLLAALPEPGTGGIVSAGWRSDNRLYGLLRISPDELKGVGALVNVAIAKSMACGSGDCSDDGEDDTDEDDNAPVDDDK